MSASQPLPFLSTGYSIAYPMKTRKEPFFVPAIILSEFVLANQILKMYLSFLTKSNISAMIIAEHLFYVEKNFAPEGKV